ncbi:MAG: NADH-quinone oxidoreductase subunit NuoE [SAR324 cluster bacterium]|uniref:NADH-quinone oxidoreductase subunit NuoE n=1 Tax=SAR324 cluster bacterium TaxID=2024889 RepID=A0A7X9FP47_9DELT|nr:NADH-quinone oxidoreductase subunit NuoE [SAR324 cluster bacterium]
MAITPEIDHILSKHPGAKRDSLIPILQEVQDNCGYLSEEAVIKIGQFLNLPPSKVYGVATFYNQFRFQPQGKYHIQICRGTACHVKGSATLLSALKRELKIDAGQTSRDGLFSLEVVACIGACGLAPVICMNGEFYAKLTPDKLQDILAECRKKEEQNI